MTKQKILVKCPTCNIPLLKRVGNKLFLRKHYDGKPIDIEIDIKHYSSGGHYKITCEKCGNGHIFASFEETINMNELPSINKKTEPET